MAIAPTRGPGARWLRGLALAMGALVAACSSSGAAPSSSDPDGGWAAGDDAGADSGVDASVDVPVACAPLPLAADAGTGKAQPLYPDPRFVQVGANLAYAKTACVDTSALPTHDKLDALVPQVLAEVGLSSAPLGSCACDWTLRFGAAPALTGTAQATLASGAGNDELYAEVTSLPGGRPSSALYATSERGGLYALRAAVATVAAAGGGLLVPASTIVDYPATKSRGFVEGEYGSIGGWPNQFASWPSQLTPGTRSEVLRLIGRLRGNTYIYGPKADPYARGGASSPNWRDPYPTNDGLQSAIQTLALDADANLVDLYWSISPFPGFDWSAPTGPDFTAVKTKIQEMRALGVHHFAMFVDDAGSNGGSPQQDAALMNATESYLESLDPNEHLLVVTWAYAGDHYAGSDSAFGDALDGKIEVMWTGPCIVSCAISAGDMSGPDAQYKRKLSIWDNWPEPPNYSDCGCSDSLKMTGRSDDLPTAITGYYTNPVIDEGGLPLSDELAQLGPVMDYAWGPAHYNATMTQSYARWGALLPAWQKIVHPCSDTKCVVPAGNFQGFACDPKDPNDILFCDQYEGNCVTTLRCPKGCKVQSNAQDTCN